jgi:hypothetical protein
VVVQQGRAPFIGTSAVSAQESRRAELHLVETTYEPPRELCGRSRWERRYTVYLRITDAAVVCDAVVGDILIKTLEAVFRQQGAH